MKRPAGTSKRIGKVVTTLMLHGLQVPLARMRLSHCASLKCRMHCTWRRWTGKRASAKPWPIAVRDSLVELGPAFVKIGQILSVRSDLVPPELAEALKSLQSEVPPVDMAEVRTQIETDLGRPMDEVFKRFDETPRGSASIAQVHEAELMDGTRVAVKVKRPGIDEVVARDLKIIVWLASKVERHIRAAKNYRPVAGARELETYTLRELDFTNEGGVATEVGRYFADWDDVSVPKIHHASRNVLIMEFIDGTQIDDVETLEAQGVDCKALLDTALNATLAQIFDLGLFHADPHPGNLHVTSDGKLVLLDFGIFGRMDERLQRDCALLMWALVHGDVELASAFMLRMATLEPDARIPEFRRAVEARYSAWRGSSVSEYGFATLLFEEISLGASHGVVFPSDAVLLGKAMVTLEGVVLAVDPSMDISTKATPYMATIKDKLFSMGRIRDAVERSLPLWWGLLERLPTELAYRLDRQLEADNRAGARQRETTSALSRGLVSASLILGSTVLLAAGVHDAHTPLMVAGGGAMLLGTVTGLRRGRT